MVTNKKNSRQKNSKAKKAVSKSVKRALPNSKSAVKSKSLLKNKSVARADSKSGRSKGSSPKHDVRKAPTVKSTVPKVVQRTETTNSHPLRAPVRKVMGSDRSLTVVESRQAALSIDSEAGQPQVILGLDSETSEIASIIKTPTVRPSPVLVKPIVRVPWSSLPASFPPHIRFFVSMAEKECRSASTWPFPYAKFLSALPVKICGRAFCAFLLWIDFESSQVADKLSMPQQELEQLVASEGALMLEYFTETCPDMYRKLATQLGGVGVSIDTLVERYLVSKVDKDFQLMMAKMVLKLMAQ